MPREAKAEGAGLAAAAGMGAALTDVLPIMLKEWDWAGSALEPSSLREEEPKAL
jgi:hypothetical protein